MQVLTEIDRERIHDELERGRFFWLDLHSPRDEDLRRIGDLLQLHPMAMEDTREFGQRPKVDVYENHVLVVFYTARVEPGADDVAVPIEVHVYVSGEYIVTIRREACDLLDRLHDTMLPEKTDV